MNSDDDGGSSGAIDGIMMTINGNDGHVDYSHHDLTCPNYDTIDLGHQKHMTRLLSF